MDEKIVAKAVQDYAKMLDDVGIVITDEERARIEVSDYGLGRLDEIGTGIVVYANTKRVCAKELMLFPWQICPEHYHPQIGDYVGKEETFRCRWGEVYLYVTGDPVENPVGRVPEDKKDTFTVWHEIVLRPGEQYTLKEQTWHWFQGGPEGAVVSEFSTPSFDDKDVFRDPEIKRVTNLD